MAENPPCKVIHLRNVASEISQEELVAAAQAFGAVEKVVMLKAKKQAMIQFIDITSAVTFMTHFSGIPLKINGRSVYASFSRHQELQAEAPNKILLVTFANQLHKTLGEALLNLVTVDLVYQIFSPYGAVHKIVMMNKDAGIQALVQFTAPDVAARAKAVLSGYTFYAGTEFGTFTIDIQFSNLTELTVRQNTQRARDFSAPGSGVVVGQPQLQPQQQQQQQPAVAAAYMQPIMTQEQFMAYQQQLAAVAAASGSAPMPQVMAAAAPSVVLPKSPATSAAVKQEKPSSSPSVSSSSSSSSSSSAHPPPLPPSSTSPSLPSSKTTLPENPKRKLEEAQTPDSKKQHTESDK